MEIISILLISGTVFIVTYAYRGGYTLCITQKVEQKVSDVVPSDEAELLRKVLEIESQIKVAERTKRQRNYAESNIQFTNCAQSLNTLLVQIPIGRRHEQLVEVMRIQIRRLLNENVSVDLDCLPLNLFRLTICFKLKYKTISPKAKMIRKNISNHSENMVSNCPQQKDAVAASLVTQTNLTPNEKINKSRQKMNYVS